MASTDKSRRVFVTASKISFILVALFLVIYLVSVLYGSSSFFDESAEKNASLYFEEDLKRVEALANAHYDNLYAVADKLNYSDRREDVVAVLGEYIGSDEFGDLRFFSHGVCYDVYGIDVDADASGYDHIAKLSVSKKQG